MGLVKAAQQQYDEAIRLHRMSIQLNPADMMVYYHLGAALEKKDMLREAAEAYHSSLVKYNEQYPSGSENKNSAEFAETVKAAIQRIESKLQ
jgi:tetratricopeptide (TPR) repeat protein